MKKLSIFIFLSIIISSVSHSHNVERENIRVFINYMVNKHGFKEEYLIDVLKKAESKESILEAISRPAERTLTWNQYRDIFIKKERINAGVDFWVENKDILERIYDKTGVDIEIMLGIIGVETLEELLVDIGSLMRFPPSHSITQNVRPFLPENLNLSC